MNNVRLSTNKNIPTFYGKEEEQVPFRVNRLKIKNYLSFAFRVPSIYIVKEDGQIINKNSGATVRDA
jgi:hypothetical protein